MVDKNLTDDQQKDVQERMDEFDKEYQALVKRLDIDFAQAPMFVPIGPGLWGIMINAQLTDKKYLPVPSDLSKLQ